MKRWAPDPKRWFLVALFAVAMAWLESATVYYLRTLVDRVQPYQQNPLPIYGGVAAVELVREAATLVMLLAVGMLAATTRRKQLAFTAVAFGIWDIFYYVFLRVMCKWPTSLFDWDILFLIPLPWWGPVLAPVSIASLMIVWGTLVSQSAEDSAAATVPWPSWGAAGTGIGIALYVFMADALRVAHLGADAVRSVLPTAFNWPLFLIALMLMAVPIAQIGFGAFNRPRSDDHLRTVKVRG
jgi:hypothetical protein